MSKKSLQIAFIVVLISFLVGGIVTYRYYNIRYLPNKKEIARLEKELEKVKEARRAWEAALKRGRGKANYEVRFNYLTSLNLKDGEIGPFVLKKLNPWFIKKKLHFEKLTIFPPEKESKLLKRSFRLYGTGRFKDIVSTMRWIEEDNRGVISDFNITPSGKIRGKKIYDTERLFFQITWYWLEGAPKRLHSVVAPKEPLFKARRNPFYPFRPQYIKKAKTVTSNKIVWKPVPSNLRLHGIMKVKGKYKAIINGRYVKAGDVIKGYKVKYINSTNVVLARKNYRYKLKLKAFKLPRNKRK